MKNTRTTKLIYCALSLLFSGILLLGCANMTPLDPQTPSTQPNTTPPKQSSSENQVHVTYNYGDTGKVQLSTNNLVLKVGQQLILEPAPGLTKNTRFTSSGEYFLGDIMQQEPGHEESGRVIFTAKKAGKGVLQIIPNNNETDRAVELLVTVQ